MADMEVLVLGLCRTGTMSMKLALEELGYTKVYHFFEVSENASHSQLWIEALEAKYGQNQNESKKGHYLTGKTCLGVIMYVKNVCMGKDDEILTDQAITDIPAACFAPELIAAYPRAKIILTTRSPESWQRSMLHTIGALHSSYYTRAQLLLADKDLKLLSHLLDLIIKYTFKGALPVTGRKLLGNTNT